MDGVVGRLAGVDAGRLRLHGVPADHGADLQGVQRLANGGDGGVHRHPLDAPCRRVRLGLVGRSGRAQDPPDDLDRLVLDL